MKFDKEMLAKNKFWVVLAVAVPLTLITIFMVVTVVSGQNAALEKAVSTVPPGKGGTYYNEANIAMQDALAKEEEGKRAKFWERAWKDQKDLYPWPDKIEKSFGYNSDGYFATEIKIVKDKFPADASPPNHFYGKITAHVQGEEDKYYIDVEENSKNKSVRRFHRTPKTDSVLVDGGKMLFNQLKIGLKVDITYQRYRNFYDPLTFREIKDYTGEYARYEQIRQIMEQVNPLIDTGEGVVLLGDGPLKANAKLRFDMPVGKFIRYIDLWEKIDKGISEEIWLAQEDLWIQKELYYRVKLVNDSISVLELDDVIAPDGKAKVKFDRKVPPKFKQLNSEKGRKFIFQNPYWRLELKQVNQTIEYKIENRLSRRQKQGVNFLIQIDDNNKEKITIEGKPLDPNKGPKSIYSDFGVIQPPKADPTKKTALTRQGIFGVEQVLSTDTAAVKRIDLIDIGDSNPLECAHAHRTFPEKLVAFDSKDQKPNEPVPPPAKDLRGGLDPKKDRSNKTEFNKLIRDRYLEVTEEMRRVPVAIVLIVDQVHIDRVLTSFRNSPMRFLMTQVVVNRYPFPLRTNVPQKADSKKPDPRGPQSNPKGQAVQPQSQSIESNVELVIYGQITLYNRYRAMPLAEQAKK